MRSKKDHLRDIIELTLCALIIFAIVDFFNYTDHTILAKRQSYHLPSSASLPHGQLFIDDEMRISNLFAEDTLPRLIQFGLVNKYEVSQSKTTLFVNGKMWKHRSTFFKHCLLKEILVHNKINGYSSATQIVDDQSRRLFAKISPSCKFEFYD